MTLKRKFMQKQVKNVVKWSKSPPPKTFVKIVKKLNPMRNVLTAAPRSTSQQKSKLNHLGNKKHATPSLQNILSRVFFNKLTTEPVKNGPCVGNKSIPGLAGRLASSCSTVLAPYSYNECGGLYLSFVPWDLRCLCKIICQSICVV